MTFLNSSSVPRWTLRHVWVTPIPCGSIRIKSSNPPARAVGRTMPTVPSLLLDVMPVSSLRSERQPKLFDHLVGAKQERLGNCEAERLGGADVDDQPEFGRLFHR